ncbi:hypothetical protein [Rhodococcus koreensis]|uniref:hypothetical protein n=1 Tax=Rhodococcus koreensis TaxID=99653 RepID=UPI00366BB01B
MLVEGLGYVLLYLGEPIIEAPDVGDQVAAQADADAIDLAAGAEAPQQCGGRGRDTG